jgi:hypothetical protein
MQLPSKIKCPQCGQPSENIKRSNLFSMFFLVIAVRWQMRTMTMCDECMRREIVKNGAINILTSNILFPFIILPTSIYQYVRSYEKGHSKGVVEDIMNSIKAQQITPEFANQLDKIRNL